MLSFAEFAYNNSHQPSIDCSPFYANYGYNPEFTLSLRSPISAPTVKIFADSLHSAHERLVENIKSAQNHQARYYNAKQKSVEFNVGDKVWLLSTNIRTERPSKKLDWKRLGPFSITKRIGTQAYQLGLPKSMLFYHVKWMGYSISENSWEPDHLLKNSSVLVKSFHSRYPSKPRPRSSRSHSSRSRSSR